MAFSSLLTGASFKFRFWLVFGLDKSRFGCCINRIFWLEFCLCRCKFVGSFIEVISLKHREKIGFVIVLEFIGTRLGFRQVLRLKFLVFGFDRFIA